MASHVGKWAISKDGELLGPSGQGEDEAPPDVAAVFRRYKRNRVTSPPSPTRRDSQEPGGSQAERTFDHLIVVLRRPVRHTRFARLRRWLRR